MPTEKRLCPHDVPNVCGHHLGGLELWSRHRVCCEDTVAHLALKHGTTVGHICRVNRLHWQDILQTRTFIWVPAPNAQKSPLETTTPSWRQLQGESKLQAPEVATRTLPNYGTVLIVPPHFYRQSAPNLDDFAGDCDPLLITTRCM